MDTYIVGYSIDGKPSGAITVKAPSAGAARELAKGKIGGKAAYKGKRISINRVSKVNTK